MLDMRSRPQTLILVIGIVAMLALAFLVRAVT
jgi:hypothetical protein